MPKATAREKLAREKQPKKVVMEKAYGGIGVGETMYVATPQIVDAYVKAIPHGETRSIPDMRDELAKREKCHGTCPMSSAIFARMVAEAALEDLADGKSVSKVTPFWRLISSEDKVAKKLALDPTWLDEQRAMEAS